MRDQIRVYIGAFLQRGAKTGTDRATPWNRWAISVPPQSHPRPKAVPSVPTFAFRLTFAPFGVRHRTEAYQGPAQHRARQPGAMDRARLAQVWAGRRSGLDPSAARPTPPARPNGARLGAESAMPTHAYEPGTATTNCCLSDLNHGTLPTKFRARSSEGKGRGTTAVPVCAPPCHPSLRVYRPQKPQNRRK